MSLEEKVVAAVEYWKDALLLQNWDISIEFKELGEDRYAECDAVGMYDVATIRFDTTNLAEAEDSLIEQTVVHELLHLIDRDRTTIQGEIEGHLHPGTYELFADVMYQHTEVIVDRLAKILCTERHKSVKARKGLTNHAK